MFDTANHIDIEVLASRLKGTALWSEMEDGTKFDNLYYLINHFDVLVHGADPYEHFNSHGRKEGRRWRKFEKEITHITSELTLNTAQTFESLEIQETILERSAFAGLAMRSQLNLEIGPFNSPLLKGAGVYYADIMECDALRGQATLLGLDPSNIPNIDFVVEPSDLSNIDKKFDSVLSSHVIEHQPDLISHLNQVAEILGDSGRYFLLIPDHRYCFDHFQTRSQTIDLVIAHQERRKRHTAKSLMDHWANTTHNDPTEHWAGNHGKVAGLSKEIVTRSDDYQKNEQAFIDCHAWYFTPESWMEIVYELNKLDLIKFEVEFLQKTQTNDLEFYTVLKKMQNS